MGSTWSADDYTSDFDRNYVTASHNGTTVCGYGSPIPETHARYNRLYVAPNDRTKVPLLRVHGVFNIASCSLEFDSPLDALGSITLMKSGQNEWSGTQRVEMSIPKGARSISLDACRTIFVAYRDGLTQLHITAELPGAHGARLNSTFAVSPERTARVMTISRNSAGEHTATWVPVPPNCASGGAGSAEGGSNAEEEEKK